MEYTIVTGELAHHGIKGMRWGVRRYQNPDGTLTPAGKKRYNQELESVKAQEQVLKNRQAVKAKYDKLEARKKALAEGFRKLDGDDESKKEPVKKAEPAPKPKKKKGDIRDLSDDELAALIKRRDMERQYRELEYKHATLDKQFRDLNPKQVSRGKKFMQEYIVPTLGESVKTVGKDFLTKKGKEWLNLDTGDQDNESRAKKRADKAKRDAELAENRYKTLKNNKAYDDLKKSMDKQQKEEEERRKKAEEERKKKEEEDD